MEMTDEQRYSAVLKELGEVLESKNTTIFCQRLQIDQLKEQLAKAEQERAEAIAFTKEINQQLLDAVCEIERLKGCAK